MTTINNLDQRWKSNLTEALAVSLMALFAYTAVAKLLDFSGFKVQMLSQAFSNDLAGVLVYAIPAAELLVTSMLFIRSLRRIGFLAAAFLMLLFTVYAGMALSGFFPQTPCPCGGVLHRMGWKAHFCFNLFFLLLSCLGIYTINRERSVIGKE